MLRITLIALATLATVAASSSAAVAQAGTPVRTLRSVDAVGSTSLMAPKAQNCGEKACPAKPAKRGYVGAPSLGW